MKKILAILLSVTMISSVFCVGVSAAETTEDSQKTRIAYDNLNMLYEFVDFRNRMTGVCKLTFSNLTDQRLEEAMDILSDSKSTLDDYITAYDNLIFAVYNENIDKYYAEMTYENALKEQNYNNWYSERDWSDFVAKRADLGNALETGSYEEITIAFYELLKCYNIMTSCYTLQGDVNKDGEVTINDATLIQKYLVGEVNFTGAQKMLIASDLDYENPDVISATIVQKCTVGLNTYFNDPFVQKFGPFHDSYERRMERTLNFTLCPRSNDGMYMLDNGYYDTQFLEDYYNTFYKEI